MLDRATAPGARLAEPLAGHRTPQSDSEEANMAGMIRKLVMSGVAAKVIQEARKPQNQAKLKKMVADFQNKNAGGKKR